MPKIPTDIITEILSLLPVKSLCRFECVSKSWHSSIHDPLFVKIHLDRSQKSKILVISCNTLYKVYPEPPIEDHVLAVEIYFPLKQPRNPDARVEVLASCNGLLCLCIKTSKWERFFVFNPSTRKSIEIPLSPVAPPPSNQSCVYGFGYAPSVDDYMFMRVSYDYIASLYSLRRNAWKRVGHGFPYLLPHFTKYGTPLNGVIHYVARHHGAGRYIIACFELVEEKFRELPPPETLGNSGAEFSLGVLKDCLCAMTQLAGGPTAHEFWMMKVYGLKDSWTKILIAEPFSSCLKPLCFWKDAKILLAKDYKQLVLCNPKDGTVKEFMVNGMPIAFDADVYVESLVSPNMGHVTNA